MNIRHGIFRDVAGTAVKSSGFTIVPAMVELEGNHFSAEFPLRELPAAQIPAVLRLPIDRQFDVAWVWARLPIAFQSEPEPSENEKTLLEEGFIAVEEGADEGIPFVCSDYYDRTSLHFSLHEMDERLKGRIADAFWKILLAEPHSLADFEARVMHTGAGIWLQFGCDDGEPYCLEVPDDGDGDW